MSIDAINKKPTIYLHIGMNKTGSTALQAWFHSKKEQLLETTGIYYPEEGLKGIAHYALSDVLGFKHGKTPVNEKDITSLQAFFLQAIKNNKCKKVVLSSEFFVLNKNVSVVKRFFENFDCKIVVYIRRHDYWWESSYNQSLKSVTSPPFPKSIDSYISFTKKVSDLDNYPALIDRWADAFGQQNIIIRPYEKAAQPKGIVADFLKVIAADNIDCSDSKLTINSSLNKRANAIVEVAQRSGLAESEIQKVLLFLRDSEIPDTKFSLLSPKNRRELIKEYVPQYRYIAKKYLGSTSGRLFAEKWPQADDTWEAFKQPEPEEIVEIIVKALK